MRWSRWLLALLMTAGASCGRPTGKGELWYSMPVELEGNLEAPDGAYRIRVGAREFPASFKEGNGTYEIAFQLPFDVYLADSPQSISMLLLSPCKDLEMAVRLPEELKYLLEEEISARKERRQVKYAVKVVVPPRGALKPWYVYVDRATAPESKVQIGKLLLEKASPVAEERYFLYQVDCDDGRAVRIDGEKVGELTPEKLNSYPAFLIASRPGRCYREDSIGFGNVTTLSYPVMQGGQIYTLKGKIEWLWQRGANSVSNNAPSVTGIALHELHVVDCPGEAKAASEGGG